LYLNALNQSIAFLRKGDVMSNSLDPFVLARIQFAANITFHILFPAITLSMSWVLLFFKIRFLKTKQAYWMEAYQFWVKVFALTFALGVVSGITMSFQFGTNWPGFMQTVGNVAGPLLAYEVLTAFFLEATMLGIMLFGRKRVGETVHTIATCLVAGGTTLSAFWILALNSWMQTPAGFEMVNGQAHVTSWFEVIFNPSFPYRFLHMMLASGLTVSFLLAGLSAYRWLRKEHSADVLASLRTGIFLAATLIPLQILVGDAHGLNTLEHQPAKLAAMEGIWDTQKGVPAVLFALPNETTRSNDFEISIPKLASLYLTHDLNGEVKGLNDFIGNHPPVAAVFWSFRIMVGVGMLMLFISWAYTWVLWKKRTQEIATMLSPMMAKILIAMTFSGWVALVAGWYTTEIGRQPWLVTGVLKSVDAVSKIAPTTVLASLIVYLILYAFLIVAYVSVLFYLARKKTDGFLTKSSNKDTTLTVEG
jgi:cytochrome bd ubiquinol oxidase subunit I